MGVLIDTEVQPEAVGKKEDMSKTNNTVVINVVRHGQKEGDALTQVGTNQIYATSIDMVQKEGCEIDRFVYSGANRTRQAIEIFAGVVGMFQPYIEMDERFNFTNLIGPGGGKDVVLAEIAQIQAQGDTVALAIETSAYARLARDQITHAILSLANDMVANSQSRAVVTSHTPYSELAAVNPEQMPYGICEGDWVQYKVMEGRIVSSTLHRCPVPGGRN